LVKTSITSGEPDENFDYGLALCPEKLLHPKPWKLSTTGSQNFCTSDALKR
jgi:hypothetical protein